MIMDHVIATMKELELMWGKEKRKKKGHKKEHEKKVR